MLLLPPLLARIPREIEGRKKKKIEIERAEKAMCIPQRLKQKNEI